MEWAEARKLLETATVRGKPAKLVVDEEVMVAVKERIWTGRDLCWRISPPNATISYLGVPLEYSPDVQGVVPVWKEEVVKVGDLVNVIDGSYSMGLVGGVWRPTFPTFGHRKAFVWRVMAMNGRFPTYRDSFSRAVPDNDVLLVDPEDDARLLATREKYLKMVSEKTAPGDESECRPNVTHDAVEKGLEQRVRELEQQINALADHPLPCCAKRVGYWRSG